MHNQTEVDQTARLIDLMWYIQFLEQKMISVWILILKRIPEEE